MQVSDKVSEYTRKPTSVFAIPICWESRFEILDFGKGYVEFVESPTTGPEPMPALMEGREPSDWALFVFSKVGKIMAFKGEMLVGTASDIYPCKMDEFLATYETPRQMSFELEA